MHVKSEFIRRQLEGLGKKDECEDNFTLDDLNPDDSALIEDVEGGRRAYTSSRKRRRGIDVTGMCESRNNDI